MLNKVFRADFAHSAALLASAVLAFAALLDLVGRILGQGWFWIAGGWVLPVGVIAAAAAGLVCLTGRPRRGTLLLLTAAFLAGLARWLRGSAAVPPDPPLIAAEILAVLFALLGYWRTRERITVSTRNA
jgi:hypothetical protein